MGPDMADAASSPMLEVLWWDEARGRVVSHSLPWQPKMTCRRALEQMPQDLREAFDQGRLRAASHGRSLHADEVLSGGDRIELLAAIQLDVRAERAARVKAVRARSRNPYNRSHPGARGPQD